jgi:S-adenosylmethionine hydrolase
MTEEKLVELVRRIENKTAIGVLKWETTASENEFQTTLSSYVIQIQSKFSRDGDHDFTLNIIDGFGNAIESVSDTELARMANEFGLLKSSGESYRLMEKIFVKAKRQALGVDSAIDNILSELE